MIGIRTGSYCEVSLHALCVLTITNGGMLEKSRKAVGNRARIGLVEWDLLMTSRHADHLRPIPTHGASYLAHTLLRIAPTLLSKTASHSYPALASDHCPIL